MVSADFVVAEPWSTVQAQASTKSQNRQVARSTIRPLKKDSNTETAIEVLKVED